MSRGACRPRGLVAAWGASRAGLEAAHQGAARRHRFCRRNRPDASSGAAERVSLRPRTARHWPCTIARCPPSSALGRLKAISSSSSTLCALLQLLPPRAEATGTTASWLASWRPNLSKERRQGAQATSAGPSYLLRTGVHMGISQTAPCCSRCSWPRLFSPLEVPEGRDHVCLRHGTAKQRLDRTQHAPAPRCTEELSKLDPKVNDNAAMRRQSAPPPAAGGGKLAAGRPSAPFSSRRLLIRGRELSANHRRAPSPAHHANRPAARRRL